MVYIPNRKPVVVPQPHLPRSFLDAGFVPPEQARTRGTKYRGLMIRSEGRSDTGKTEFVLSCPGPGVIIACDRGFDATFDNQQPPPARRKDFGIRILQMPTATDFGSAADYVPYYRNFYVALEQGLSIPEARTLCVDGDNFTWNLQKLAEWGKITGVYPQVKYFEPTEARMSLYWKMWNTGKVIVTTNWVKDEWHNVLNPDGTPKLSKDGEAIREKTGGSVSMGFPNQNYLWDVCIQHLFKAAMVRKIAGREIRIGPQWGLRITKCKANPNMIGEELWGDECNFRGLVQKVYPHIAPEAWGL